MLQLGIVGWYEINKAYVSHNLCENRNDPNSSCAGKCYLKKQLKAAEERQEHSQQYPGTHQEYTPVISFVLPAGWQQLPAFITPSDDAIHRTCYLSPAGINPLHSIFHPPQVVV